jgi:5,6-dimethylbenzimidazole synthase
MAPRRQRFKREPLPEGTNDRLIDIACLSPSVGLSEPWRYVIIDDPTRRAGIRQCFETCHQEALQTQTPDRVTLYARLKLAGLDDAPCQIGVYADRTTAQGHELGRLTHRRALDYSVAIATYTLWLAARAEGIGVGWVSILDPVRVAEILEIPAEWVFDRASLHRLSGRRARHSGLAAPGLGAAPPVGGRRHPPLRRAGRGLQRLE